MDNFAIDKEILKKNDRKEETNSDNVLYRDVDRVYFRRINR